ncbi:MAG TPA: response regulator [bacterium]|nr:response regulator [bacterium]HOL47278.1 response regulator [bacterium]HPQ18694.1 response regulator [bacterium]
MKTILVVEDSKALQQILNLQLTNSGYKVIQAYNGIEALKQLTHNEVDLILSDVMMPEMDGFEFCKRVKMNEKYKNIPFIILTAKAYLESKLEGLNYGADRYIYKPYNFNDLLNTIQELLEQKGRFQLKVKGKNQYEFNIKNSLVFIDELNNIIKEICWSNQDFISEVDSLIFTINIIKKKLIQPIINNMDISFAFAYNNEKYVLKIEGFEKNYLKDKIKEIKEIQNFIPTIKINSEWNKILLIKKYKEEEFNPVEDELFTITETLTTIENQLKTISGGVVKKSEEIKKEEEKKEEEKKEPIDAKYNFKILEGKLIFEYSPPKNKGKEINIEEIEEYCKKNHFVKVSFQIIKNILKENKEERTIVGYNQYDKEKDAWVEVDVSDKFNAYIELKPPKDKDGKKLNFDYVYEVLQLYNLNQIKIKPIQDAIKNKEYNKKILVAEGIKPTAGADAEIKYSLLKENEEVYVARGQLIFYKTLPQIGKSGVDIFNYVVPPLKGKDINIKFGQNIFSDAKELRFFAGCNGILKFKDNYVSLTPCSEKEKIYKYENTYKFVEIELLDLSKSEIYASEMLSIKESNLSSLLIKKNDKKKIRVIESLKIFKGETIEKIKEKALEYFNINDENLLVVKILEKGVGGLFGIGKKDYIAEVYYNFEKIDKEKISKFMIIIDNKKANLKILKNKYNGLLEKYSQTSDEQKEEKEKIKGELKYLKEEIIKIIKEVTEIQKQIEGQEAEEVCTI